MPKKRKIKNPYKLTLLEAVQIAEGEVEVEEDKIPNIFVSIHFRKFPNFV